MDAAHVLVRSDKDPELAIRLLQQYLASPNQSADAPAFRVHAFLGQLLQTAGRTKEAQEQFAAAAALASGYRVASDTLVASGR